METEFNKLKTNIKKNNKNKSKCTVFMTEKEYDEMVNIYKSSVEKAWAMKRDIGDGYLKIGDNKYVKIGLYIGSTSPNGTNSYGIRSIYKKDINVNDICFVKNYDSFMNNNKYNNKFIELFNNKERIDHVLRDILIRDILKNKRASSIIIKQYLSKLLIFISSIILKYERLLEIQILTYNKVNNINKKIKENSLNENKFYNIYSDDIINLLIEFQSTEISNYVKFQSILTKLSILIYKYDKITNSSISSQLKNNYN